jgi:membrane fusion protein, copper/silver efflux system
MNNRIAVIAALMAIAAAPTFGGDFHPPLRTRVGAAFTSAQRAAAAGQASAGEGKILYYQDPMHPWYHSDKPGIAPDCGMKLVPVYASDLPGTSLAPGGVEISPARQQLMGVTTVPAEYLTLDQTIRTPGQVAIDETRLVSVHIRTTGWIQKVFVDYTFQHVSKGDPLFTIYCPDVFAAEQEYLLALKAQGELSLSSIPAVASAGTSLLQAARRRLELLDLTDAQIRELEQTGKPTREITVYSPATGHVVERKAFPNQYVTPDTELYKLEDHHEVWVIADVYEPQVPFVELGQEAVLTADSLPGKMLIGHVNFIPPHIMEDTRTLPVRLEVPNPNLELKPGMFVTVELHRGLGRRLTVPVDAVLDSGTHQRVFVARGKGVFEPRAVTVGARSGDYAVILGGLRAGEQVVTRANFLIDSESNLRESVEGMQPAERHP